VHFAFHKKLTLFYHYLLKQIIKAIIKAMKLENILLIIIFSLLFLAGILMSYSSICHKSATAVVPDIVSDDNTETKCKDVVYNV